MPRAKNAVAARARRKKVLKQTKGNFGARKNVWTVAKNTYEKGLTYIAAYVTIWLQVWYIFCNLCTRGFQPSEHQEVYHG